MSGIMRNIKDNPVGNPVGTSLDDPRTNKDLPRKKSIGFEAELVSDSSIQIMSWFFFIKERDFKKCNSVCFIV
jgi:hypothetical protein